MGDDPKASVLDQWCRSHDIPNLYVVDASSFVTHPEKQTTLTLAFRAADHLAEQFWRGDI
jgi:choline dehydrogenase-like flavoprotein